MSRAADLSSSLRLSLQGNMTNHCMSHLARDAAAGESHITSQPRPRSVRIPW